MCVLIPPAGDVDELPRGLRVENRGDVQNVIESDESDESDDESVVDESRKRLSSDVVSAVGKRCRF